MSERVNIRTETLVDIDAIEEVTIEAFKTLEVSDQTEHFIVAALRSAGALTISLVAENEGQVVGHVVFSPVRPSDGTDGWYGLAPVSVLPEHQGRGIGSALIREGLERLKAIHAKGCCVVGHPGYYGRFGFENPSGLGVEGVPPEAFFTLAWTGPVPQGVVELHPAFMSTGKA